MKGGASIRRGERPWRITRPQEVIQQAARPTMPRSNKARGFRGEGEAHPYLNTDAGTMSPFEHGEVFVLDDGRESVIEKERRGDYLGKTVQVVAHITDAIQEWIERVAKIPVDRKEGPAVFVSLNWVRIAMVGKYTGLLDAYLSFLKDPEAYKVAWNLLKGADGVLVRGGFGDGGVQGKILAAKYAREHSVPFLGICLGMQIVVNE
ncbi:uncharacterized protein HKW66_Vig0179860 [Vigna angularis]|uniref:CTP synthase n=1 Tax=Phaseolus angularis TaxID=3914 RepID=A0A8T0K4Y4_PHAAN|nr:uncharacterized protein HKW66_Vig0179860 [Vigna angularis]